MVTRQEMRSGSAAQAALCVLQHTQPINVFKHVLCASQQAGAVPT